MPTINLGKVTGDKGTSIRNRGEWNATAQYVNSENYVDMVSHNGNLWTCLVTNTNVEPAEGKEQWNLSAKGISNVYFTEATDRENIVSGEQTSTSFGKIAKWFSDLKDSAFSVVANNLTTTAAGSVLDARQGKALKDNRIVSLEDIDLVTEPGFFTDALAVKELNRNFKESVYADGYMVVDIGALPNNSTKSVPANIPSAASEYWISNAWCKSRATGQVSPMPYIDVSTWSNAIGITISASKNIVVITKADWSAYSGKAVIAYKLSFI